MPLSILTTEAHMSRLVVRQFCHSLHQEVVYNSISHKHRRSLHRKAAGLLEEQLQGVTGILESRPYLKELTRHLLKAARLSSSCSGSGTTAITTSYHRMDKSELQALSDALVMAAQNSQALGNFEETVDYWVRPSSLCSTANCALSTCAFVHPGAFAPEEGLPRSNLIPLPLLAQSKY